MRIDIRDYQKIANVGDRIATNGDSGNAVSSVFTGKVTKIENERFLMIRDDIHAGSAHEWEVKWKPREIDIVWIEIISAAKKVEPEDKSPKVKKKIYITLEKESTGISISLKIPEEIEEYYKTLSKGETQESKGWFYKKGHGAIFYKLSEEAQRGEKRIDGETFSDFGNGLLRDDQINTAILRTVGASKGIKITSEHFSAVNNIDLEYYIKRLGIFIKRLWETSIAKKTIKSIITYEL